jgi:hypothetical protein
MHDDTLKQVYVIEELDVAVKLIKAGFRELQHIDDANDFYHLPFLTLAGGFERLMKIVICLHIHETTGSFPREYPWQRGRQGHDLMWLLDYMVDHCFSSTYLKIPVAQDDITFLRTDKKIKIRSVIRILSSFGQAARYYNLDVIYGQTQGTDSPEEKWGKLEAEIMQDNSQGVVRSQHPSEEIRTFERVNIEIVSMLERFTRALCRLFTIGDLGQKARQVSPIVNQFIKMKDDEFGKIKY